MGKAFSEGIAHLAAAHVDENGQPGLLGCGRGVVDELLRNGFVPNPADTLHEGLGGCFLLIRAGENQNGRIAQVSFHVGMMCRVILDWRVGSGKGGNLTRVCGFFFEQPLCVFSANDLSIRGRLST